MTNQDMQNANNAIRAKLEQVTKENQQLRASVEELEAPSQAKNSKPAPEPEVDTSRPVDPIEEEAKTRGKSKKKAGK